MYAHDATDDGARYDDERYDADDDGYDEDATQDDGGMSPAERKGMMREMEKMMDRMQEMMSDMRGMMMQGMMGRMPFAEPKREEQMRDIPKKTQERSVAGVTVKVSLMEKNETIRFKVVFDTHTVDLDKYKLDEVIILSAEGKEYKARVISEEGSGHHRSAVIEFDNPKTKEIEVVIKDVGGVKERVFKF